MFEKMEEMIPAFFKPWTRYLILVFIIYLIFRKYGGSHIQPW